MSSIEIISKVEALKEWQALADEAAAEIEAIKDAIKRELDNRNVDELQAGSHMIYWKPVTTNRVDTVLLRKALPDVAAAFTKTTTSRRFTIS